MCSTVVWWIFKTNYNEIISTKKMWTLQFQFSYPNTILIRNRPHVRRPNIVGNRACWATMSESWGTSDPVVHDPTRRWAVKLIWVASASHLLLQLLLQTEPGIRKLHPTTPAVLYTCCTDVTLKSSLLNNMIKKGDTWCSNLWNVKFCIYWHDTSHTAIWFENYGSPKNTRQ